MAGLSKSKVDNAVIAAAGFGTRLMPLTLHQPKAMVAVADRPLIHYIIDQIAAGGIKRFIIVINPKFQAVKKYINYQSAQGEWRDFEFIIVEKNSAGFADSILAAEKYTDKKHFIAAACDDLLDDKIPPFRTLIKIFNRHQQPMAILRQVPKKEISRYGGVAVSRIAKDILRVHDITEKPSPEEAPSTFGSIADYILPPNIFAYIRLAKKTLVKGKEPAVVHALKLYLADKHPFMGWVFRGDHFDGGSMKGLIRANIHFGIKHPELGKPFKKYLQSL